jgi:hypothetical protein
MDQTLYANIKSIIKFKTDNLKVTHGLTRNIKFGGTGCQMKKS